MQQHMHGTSRLQAAESAVLSRDPSHNLRRDSYPAATSCDRSRSPVTEHNNHVVDNRQHNNNVRWSGHRRQRSTDDTAERSTEHPV